jgi:hypothetical protein
MKITSGVSFDVNPPNISGPPVKKTTETPVAFSNRQIPPDGSVCRTATSDLSSRALRICGEHSLAVHRYRLRVILKRNIQTEKRRVVTPPGAMLPRGTYNPIRLDSSERIAVPTRQPRSSRENLSESFLGGLLAIFPRSSLSCQTARWKALAAALYASVRS